MISFFHTFLLFSSELFLLWSEWEIFHVSTCQPVVRKGQQQVQPVRPGKLQEAHSCLKQRDAFNLLCSCIKVKFIAEGVVWAAEKVDMWHIDNFPVHVRMQSCLGTKTEQVCTPYYLCASSIWCGIHRALHLLHIVFPKSREKINPHCTQIPWSQTERTAGAAQVTECYHLAVGFEGSVPKYCF